MFNMFKNKSDCPIEKAKVSIEKGEGVFVDVREEFEVASGYAEGALWLPLSKLGNDPAGVLEKFVAAFGKDKEYFLYCRSGNRSGQAEHLFHAHGLKAHNAGGFGELVAKQVLVATGIPKSYE